MLSSISFKCSCCGKVKTFYEEVIGYSGYCTQCGGREWHLQRQVSGYHTQTKTMIYCPKCNRKPKKGENYCEDCGSPVQEKQYTEEVALRGSPTLNGVPI